MTVSLISFLENLIKERSELSKCDDVYAMKVVIVDDNAQLSQENRLQNSLSFASSATGSSCHLNSRWCTQPSFQSDISNQTKNKVSSPTFLMRRQSYGMNAAWDAAQAFSPSSIDWLAASGSMDAMGQDHQQVYRKNKSSPDFSAPKLPSRGNSPCLGIPKVSVCSRWCAMKPSSSSSRISGTSFYSSEGKRTSTLRDALGSMAPSPLLAQSLSLSKKKKSSSSNVIQTTSLSSGVKQLQSHSQQDFCGRNTASRI